MTSIGHPPRIREKVKHIITSTMLCCGRKKETREGELHIEESGAFLHGMPARRLGPPARLPARPRFQPGQVPEMVIQSDFRKISGISTEVFRQIEAVENDYDATTAANLEAVEKRGEMIIRLLDPRTLGRVGAEAGRKYLAAASDSAHTVQFVEIIKRPGQTLGLYIREGDGIRCLDGVFISRIALESAVYNSGLLKVGDEILAVNLVDVRHMSLDDVVIIMSIPRRLVLTIRSKSCSSTGRLPMPKKPTTLERQRPPVVVIKKEVEEDINDDLNNGNSENGQLIMARTKGLPSEMPPVAVPLDHHHHMMQQPHQPPNVPEDHCLYYNSQPPGMRTHPPGGPRPPTMDDLWGGGRDLACPRTGAPVVRQPKLQYRYPKTLESLAEQVHSFHADVMAGGRPGYGQQPPRPERSSAARHKYWDEHGGALRGRQQPRLLRTESEQRIPSTDDAFERYATRSLRPGLRSGSGMQFRGRAQRYYYDDAGTSSPHVGILRRRSLMESCSDTEVQSSGIREPVVRHHRSLGRALPPRTASRSNSLPRVRGPGGMVSAAMAAAADLEARRHRQSVRFDKNTLPYDSQEDSDGALSAPELPATRSARRMKGGYMASPNVFTSGEYRSWMSRAPSTSAIYERVRCGRTVRQSPLLPRIAHSAESLLDTLRQEQHKSLLASELSMGRSPSLLTSTQGLAAAVTPRLAHAYSMDYVRHMPPHPTPVRPSEERVQLLTLNPREFLKYRPEKDSAEAVLHGDGGFSGLLWIHLLAARGLRPTGHGAGSDPFRDLYCVIECDRVHKARTVVRTGEHSFDWDEVFELDLVDNTTIAFLLYSWDPQLRHKLCYKGTVHLLTVLRESPVHSLALKLEPRGSLYLRLRYRDPRQTFARPLNPAPTALFGAPLEALMARENSPLGLPLLVKRCVEQAEKRGLDIVGIYRLCGSAVRKRMLREAFERNAWKVDLSAEHVPDINVITSLLKDYLRELPEPLFTKGLFDMLVDGLSVCLPDDPEGNAKLMFSILECLPKANRCTALFLLDHLKLVSSRSERNKMTCHSLATCFGPVVMCHTETGSPVADLHKPIEVFTYLLEIWPLKRVNTVAGGPPSTTRAPTEAEQGDHGEDTASSAKKTWSGQRSLPESAC